MFIVDTIYEFVIRTLEPLYQVIYRGEYFFIDYWSFVHLINGFIIVALFIRNKHRRVFTKLISILLSWEIVELAFTFLAIRAFKPEIIPDQFTDMVIGTAGGWMAWLLKAGSGWKLKSLCSRLNLNGSVVLDILVAFGMASLWVGYYGYTYNLHFFNSPFINWFACLLWTAWLFVTLRAYRVLERVIRNRILRWSITWLGYFACLLMYEYIGHYILNVQLVTVERPLVFGLIHGTWTLKLFYIVAGLGAIAISKGFTRLTVYGASLSPIGRYGMENGWMPHGHYCYSGKSYERIREWIGSSAERSFLFCRRGTDGCRHGALGMRQEHAAQDHWGT